MYICREGRKGGGGGGGFKGYCSTPSFFCGCANGMHFVLCSSLFQLTCVHIALRY